MKNNLDAFYTFTDKFQKYTKNRKDYYFRCLIKFFVRHTYLTPIELINEISRQYRPELKEDQSFIIDDKEWRIRLSDEKTTF